MQAKIVQHNGSPAISVGGEIFPPMMATIRTHTKDKKETIFDESYFKALGQAGIRIFFLICDTEWTKAGAHAQFQKEAEQILAAVPDAYILARIGLHPPNEWTQKNSRECFTYDDGTSPPMRLSTESFTTEYTHLYSLCSAAWKTDALTALENTCDFIDSLPFCGRIIGYFFAAGGTSEWYYLLNLESGDRYGDFSAAFKCAFSDYLKEKYETDAALQSAWKEPNVTINDPKIPALRDRYFARRFDEFADALMSNDPITQEEHNNIGVFLDVDKNMAVMDFYRAWHVATAKSQVFFAKFVKERYNGQKLTGSFYGSYGCTDFFNASTAGGVLEILDSGYMDFLAAPGVYVNRQTCGFAGQREMTESFRLRNMIFIVEDDARTHLETPYYRSRFDCYSIEDTFSVLKRDFGRNICEDTYGWWFDQHIGGGRYRHKDIYALFARQQKIAHEAFSKNRQKRNEIALIYDEESISAVSNRTTIEVVENFRNYEAARVGAGMDYYFHNDLSHPSMPDYKLYVFCNTFVLTRAEREAIIKKLQRNNATALFIYASGVISPNDSQRFSAKNISQLTGMNIQMRLSRCDLKYSVTDDAGLKGLDSETIYGSFSRPIASNLFTTEQKTVSYAYPLFYVEDNSVRVLARFKENNLPAISEKNTDGFRAIFYSAKILHSEILRAIAKHAGCHVTLDSDDVSYISERYICIHASTSGEKTLHFKTPCSPHEVYEDKQYGEKAAQIKIYMKKGTTLMFELRG